MKADRRSFLKYSLASYAIVQAGTSVAKSSTSDNPEKTIARQPGYKRIATEEAWTTPEIVKQYGDLIRSNPEDEPGFLSMGGFIYTRGTDSPLVKRLQDIGDGRIRDMNELGIDMQVLSLTAPGVQVFDKDMAKTLAKDSNDQLAEAVRKHPDRFAGLIAVAPQDPKSAAREIERGMKELGLNGVIINSHTKGEYLDEPKFWEIFEAAEASSAPIYIHPRTPAPSMLEPYVKRHLDMAILGFGAEVALHVMAIITSGVFDRFPNLQIVIGHMGEALPFWMYRIGTMQTKVREPSGRGKKLQRLPSEYMKENIYITTSGVAWEPAILFSQQVLGVDRVLYAMDYPYQNYPEEVVTTDNLPISDMDKKKLYQLNAEKVFSLKQSK